MNCVAVWRCPSLSRTIHLSSRKPVQTMAKHKGSRRTPAQKKPPLTHFLCLPLVTPDSKPQLEASLKAFRNGVSPNDANVNRNLEYTSENDDSDSQTVTHIVHPKAIRPLGALHYTLGVMSLDKDKLDEAVEFLQNLDVSASFKGVADHPTEAATVTPATDDPSEPASLERPITPPNTERAPGPLKVDLKGLESMHAPQKTSILYSAPEDGTGRLYPFCLALQKLFKDKGFLVEDDRQLKLHATIVNTIYAKGRKRPQRSDARQQASGTSNNDMTNLGPSAGAEDGKPQGHGPNANAPLKIDATSLLEQYKGFVWAEGVVLDRVAICEMGAKKILDDEGNVKGEEYTEIATIALPS